MAFELLDGFGDAQRGEWIKDRPMTFHLLRRLSEIEEKRVGEAVDCRTTKEAQERYEAIKSFLPQQALYLVKEEVPTVEL